MSEWSVFWQDFAEWFWTIPPFGQLLVSIGLATLIVLICIGVYYLVKGILYLVYYTLKLVYYIIKGLVVGTYRIIEWLYYGISGKENPRKKKAEAQKQVIETTTEVVTPVVVEQKLIPQVSEEASFCPYCGVKFSERAVSALKSNGIVFCHFCGKGFKEGTVAIEN